ncbi:MAG: cobalamin-dependent protein [Thermomicrobiales bacterium]
MTDSHPQDQAAALMSIGAVVTELRRTYPDVTHSSLRFLEREGLVHATRTPGGHRLYTMGDVERIRQIKLWQLQRLSLQEIHERLIHLDSLPATSKLTEEFLMHALAGNVQQAYRSVIAAADVGLSLEMVFAEVLDPALRRVGDAWEQGDLLVAQEKEISELSRELITELTLRHLSPVVGTSIVAACVEGEKHELGLRMICGLLRARGFGVHFLGADVAPRFLLEATKLHRPAAVLLSAMMTEQLPAVEDAIRQLVSRGTVAAPIVIVGGQIAAHHADAIRAFGAIPLADSNLTSALTMMISLLPPAFESPGS